MVESLPNMHGALGSRLLTIKQVQEEKREKGRGRTEWWGPFLCHRVKLGLNEGMSELSVQDLQVWHGLNINLNNKQDFEEEDHVVSSSAPEFKPAWMIGCREKARQHPPQSKAALGLGRAASAGGFLHQHGLRAPSQHSALPSDPQRADLNQQLPPALLPFIHSPPLKLSSAQMTISSHGQESPRSRIRSCLLPCPQPPAHSRQSTEQSLSNY